MIRKPATIHDIANHLNISPSTVSRALSDHPRISAATKKLVVETARVLNYNPNRLASNLRKGAGSTIGVVLPLINRHFFANIISGIEKVTANRGFSVIICQSSEKLENEIESLHTLLRNRVAGILISLSSESRDNSHLKALKNSNVPIVLFDRSIEDPEFDKVIINDFRGAYLATSHMIDQGYTNILHFSGPLQISTYRRRFEGYRQALLDRGIPFDPKKVYENVINREKAELLTEELIRSGLPMDAIFSASDMSALGALIRLKAHHIKVPEEIGVAGYVNEPFAAFIDPSLTSIEQFGEKIGIRAAETLLKKIDGSANPEDTQLIEPELIVRKSTDRIIQQQR
ncbi:MAG: LacI family DNA-binding transcriptional regulator [Bacteroidales bacterium]|nr:LacI family DNA-binding transcriptional regulator [Bacteroidales bacterium]